MYVAAGIAAIIRALPAAPGLCSVTTCPYTCAFHRDTVERGAHTPKPRTTTTYVVVSAGSSAAAPPQPAAGSAPSTPSRT